MDANATHRESGSDRSLSALRALALALALLLSACASRPGRFYSDDGPPDHVPANIAATPDAVPRDEPLNPYANRPYQALGRTYVPDTSDAPFSQRGMASWYGRQFQGNRTASGEPYDMFAMTAAHPTLPIPSYARVTNARDGRSVIVRINDRGPFLYDRIIDLSYAAAVRLGIAGPGSGEVTVDKIQPRLLARATTAGAGETVRTAAPAPIAGAGATVGGGTNAAASAVAEGAPAAFATTTTAAATPPSAPAAAMPVAASAAPPAPTPRWSVQLGAFAVAANAAALRDRLALLLSAPEAARLPGAARVPRVEQDGRLSRVLIGSLPDRATAQQWARQIETFLVRETVLYVR